MESHLFSIGGSPAVRRDGFFCPAGQARWPSKQNITFLKLVDWRNKGTLSVIVVTVGGGAERGRYVVYAERAA